MSPPPTAALDDALFEVVLTALAEPGQRRAVPAAAAGEGLVARIADAIWPDTTPVWSASGLRQLPGRQVGAADAEVLHTTGDDAARLGIVSRGTATTPQSAATVLLAAVTELTPVLLDGPGLAGVLRCTLPLSRSVLSVRNERCADRPMGIDLVVVEAASVIGLPRSTRVTLP